MGVPDDLAHASIRFGLGRFNTMEEVEYTMEEVARIVGRLRSIDPANRFVERSSVSGPV
jgi:cysteine desulfurase